MQAGKGRQGIGHLGEGGGLGAARKGAETPGDHLAADVARLLGPAGGLREQHGIVANEGGQRLDHLRVEHRRLRAARAAGEIVHPGEHMVAHEGLLAAQGHGQIAHVPRAQLGERALGLMGHKAAHGGDMVVGNAHETRKLKPVLAKDGAHGQGVLLEDGRILRAVGRFHRLAGQLARANEQARVLVAGLLGQHRAIDAFSEVFQKAPEPLHGRIIAGVFLHHIAGGLRQHACHHSRIRRTAEQLVEQRVQIRARQKQRLQVDGLATHVDDIGHDGSLL